MWIKESELKGLVWDLTIISVKNFRSQHIIHLHNQHQILELLNRLYKSATSNIFGGKKDFYVVGDELNQKNPKQTTDINDFTRYFKAYTNLSIMLSL